jgi:hypothetical protein
MKKVYEEPILKVVDYELLDDVSLTIGGTLSNWDTGDGEDFGF